MIRLVYAYVGFFFSWALCSASWVGLEEGVQYLLAPGFCMSERNAAYYCNHYHATTGETITSQSSMEVLPSSCISFNFPEVQVAAKPANLVSRVVSRIQQFGLSIHDRLRQTFIQGVPEKDTIARHWLNVDTVDLGQEKDVAVLSDEYDALCKTSQDSPIVLYGVSRGSATTFIFMGSHYLDKSLKNVKLVILEGCYDSLQHLLHHISGIKGWFYERFAHKYLPAFFGERIEPLDFVTLFPHDVPILFVTSKKDTTVAHCCTKNLCKQLVEAGHPAVYLLELENSGHLGYFCHDISDVSRYKSVVHALYKLYGLPYIAEDAEQGEELIQDIKQSR